MAYFVLEEDPIFSGDAAGLKSYLSNYGFASNTDILTNTDGSQEQFMVELPNASLQPGLSIISGPMSQTAATAYLIANSW